MPDPERLCKREQENTFIPPTGREDVRIRGKRNKFAPMDMGSHGEETRESMASLFVRVPKMAHTLRKPVYACDSMR